MSFIETVPTAEAADSVAELYENDSAQFGHIPNFTKAFSLRPDVYAIWRQLNGAIRNNMDLRRYELATVAAARRIKSTYCVTAHSSILIDKFMDQDAVVALLNDHHAAGLDEHDMAVMDLADKVAGDASSVTEADLDRLRAVGLSDREIFDVVLAAAARCFFSKALDATGTRADSKYLDLDAGLRDAFTVGRPIADE
jgi:uncharacterized peroxidase-related enzyme